MGSVCPGLQECFNFGATFHTGIRIFRRGRAYPKLQLLTEELLGIMLEKGYKIGRLYFAT